MDQFPYFSRPTLNPFFEEVQQLDLLSADTNFGPISTTTPQPTQIQDVSRPTVPVTASELESEIRAEMIYDDELNENWLNFQSSGMTTNLSHTGYVHEGKNAVEITPGEDFGSFFFVVSPDSSEVYRRDQVLGFQFWINGGDSSIETDDLSVTVVGSNQYPYYVPGDSSVTNTIEPVFPETRLYFLDVNHAIPPNTWVPIEVWLDDLIYDPLYQYVTGFYIKNDEGYRNSFYIDDIEIRTFDTEIGDTPEPTPTSTPTPTPEVLPTITIYDETLNENWSLVTSTGIEYVLQKRNAGHNGDYAISLTPTSKNGKLAFTVKFGSNEVYLREQTEGVRFWLYSGDATIGPQDLTITIVGSNDYAYWRWNDTSVTNDNSPIFSETSLFDLNIKNTIPPDTWVHVNLILDDLPFDPMYKYVTGIYIENGDDFHDTIYIDQIELVLAPGF